MSSQPTIISSRPLEVALIAACSTYAGEVVSWLAEKKYLTVPEEEVIAELSKLRAPSIVSARSAAMKKVRATKKPVTVEMAQVRAKPEMPLPFCGVIEESWCMGIRFNHGLHTQCTNGPVSGGKYCTTCLKSAKNSASGKPTYGDITDRLTGELLEYRDPKGKQTTCYANVAAKMGLDLEKAQAEAQKFGWTIPEDQLTVKVVKRGRPASKKPKVVKAKGKRGRPAKKATPKATMDDQIAALVAEAAEDVMGESIPKKKVVRKTAEEKEAEKLAKKQAKEAEKAAKKQAKEAEKAAKKAAKEAEKAAKKAAKKAEKAAKKAAKEAEKAAKKAAKEAEKAAKKAEPSKTEIKKKQLQKEASDIGCEISDEQLATLKIGEIRQLIKEHKATVKAQAKVAKAASSKKVTHTLMGECTVKSVTTFQGGIATTVTPVAEKPVEKPKTIESKVDQAIAELDEELMVDSSDDEEEELELDENTPTVTIDGVEYYKVTVQGQEGVLIDAEGNMVGVHNEEDNSIIEIEEDDE
jgi:hypothetical protein